MADPRKTLADYHPQHDAFCDSSGCSVCGRWCCDGGHIRVPKPCTCGLDALLHPPSVTPEAREVLAHLEHAFAARLVGKLEHPDKSLREVLQEIMSEAANLVFTELGAAR